MELQSQTLQNAFLDWSRIPNLQILKDEAQGRYSPNTIGARRQILGALVPIEVSQIPEIVKIASQHQVPIFPLSTGRNWGYGSSLPSVDGCVILDLEKLNRILHLDPQLGVVTVEPGVTQQQLSDFLQKQNLPFMVPTTGAGPTGSLLGNALEKGFGITPYEDHFGALLSLKAVLADGSIYHSMLDEMGGDRVAPIFKWKLGPYLDGLFVQSHFGVVTQATIALAHKPENLTQFVALIEDSHFEEAVEAVRRIKQKLGGVLGGVNLMNKRRLLAMVESPEIWCSTDVLPEIRVRELAIRRKLSDWAMLGGIYGPKELTPGAREIIRQELRPFAKRIQFLSDKQLTWMERLQKHWPKMPMADKLPALRESMNILQGIPSRVALPLAYLKAKSRPAAGAEMMPDRDGCGLIWFSPLLPLDASLVRDFIQEATRVCIAEGIEPMITLTAISERCFDSTIPLVFDVRSEADRAKARRCFDTLIEVAQEFRVFPYRMDIESQRRIFDRRMGLGASFSFAEKLLAAADPSGIFSPGRYSSTKRPRLLPEV